MPTKNQPLFLWYLAIAPLLLFLLFNVLSGSNTQTLSYSEFKTLVKADKVSDLTISDDEITGVVRTTGLEDLLPSEKVANFQKMGQGN